MTRDSWGLADRARAAVKAQEEALIALARGGYVTEGSAWETYLAASSETHAAITALERHAWEANLELAIAKSAAPYAAGAR